jgi:phosphoenolpyruvate synthase/pyruvate phosphate dikinase
VRLIREVAEKVFSATGISVSYKVGTMIEIPRAALVADEVRYYDIIKICTYLCQQILYLFFCSC